MDVQWVTKIDALIAQTTPHCKGIVVLGLDAPADELAQGFKAFRGAKLVRGFAVGRTIFGQAAKAWLAGEIDDAQLIAQVADNYTQVTRSWQAAMQA